MATRHPRQLARPNETTPIHEAEIYRLLERRIAEAGTLTLAASALGVSPQLLSAVLQQTRALGPKLLGQLGIRRTVKRVVSYELAGSR